MFSNTVRSFALIACGVILTTASSGMSQHASDKSLTARSEGHYVDITSRSIFDDFDDFDARELYDARDLVESAQTLAVHDYIDNKIDLALRSYGNDFEKFYRRHSEEEIQGQIARWTASYNDCKRRLPEARRRLAQAKRAFDAAPNDPTLKRAYRFADGEVDSMQETMGGAEERIEFWRKQRPSPPARQAASSNSRHSSSGGGGSRGSSSRH